MPHEHITPSTLMLILLIRSRDMHVNPGAIKCHNTSHTTQPVINVASVDEFQHFSRKHLHFNHLNVRSLLPKLDELNILAAKTNAAVIGITESWLNDTPSSHLFVAMGKYKQYGKKLKQMHEEHQYKMDSFAIEKKITLKNLSKHMTHLRRLLSVITFNNSLSFIMSLVCMISNFIIIVPNVFSL